MGPVRNHVQQGIGAVRWLAPAALTAGAAFVVASPHRSDYAGHFLAGFGGTLLVLAALRGARRPLGWDVVAVTVAAIGLGAVAEQSVFRLAIFDPVDFCNQSLGATLAAAGMVGSQGSAASVAAWVALALLALAAGFVLAFA